MNSKIEAVFNVIKKISEQFLKAGNLTKVNGSFNVFSIKIKHVTKHFFKNRDISINR